MTELHEMTALESGQAIAERRISAVELVDALLARIKRLEPGLLAWETIDPDAALGEARLADEEIASVGIRGPLHGVPFGVKDIYYTAGLRTTMSSKIYRDFVPDHDATSIARMRTAGMVVLGKTVSTEFASGDPPRTRNPWNHEHTPGGSSSGSAAAVASRMCSIATGSQTAGSICRPAAYNGIVGFKPTFGRVSRFGVYPLSWSFDTVGWMARSVADCAAMLDVASGLDPQDPSTRNAPGGPVGDTYRAPDNWRPRIGLVGEYFNDRATPEIVSHTRAVADRLANAGARIEEFRLPASFDGLHEAHLVVHYAEAAVAHRETFARQPDDYSPGIRASIEAASLFPVSAYVNGQRMRQQFHDELHAALSGFDAIVMASTPSPAPRDLSSTGDPIFQTPWTNAGTPEVSIPTGLSGDGLPMGVQFVSAAWNDAGALRAAHWAEQVLGVNHGLPPSVA